MKGKVHKFGDDVNTDEIIPARYLNTDIAEELARHCMEDADPQFVKKAAHGDIIVAGKNFGCGSSREHAPIAIKALGISCVVAASFARIFFRNAINIGLPIIEHPELAAQAQAGDVLEIDLESAAAFNRTRNLRYTLKPLPGELLEIFQAGGLMSFVARRVKG